MKAFIVLAALCAVALADSDPLLYGLGLPYTTVAAGYAGHNAAGLPTLKASPCVNAAGVPQPCAAGVVGYPYTLGAHVIAKRDAEADPALLYSGYPYWNAGYLGYAGLTHPSNVGLCLNYVGQRVPC